MYVSSILVTGYTDGIHSSSWLKQEMQKLLDRHAPFLGSHLRVKMVEVMNLNPDGRVRRAQTEAVKT